ncbi:uncharacterized protein LOC123876195 [Maniola jurtina]|uniref:uncharacterized protein LOC123876195 n=1 Tax=Maniola jurtina TaxID=191418 RepID=UPI001E68BCAE|nr:uncharacterized protein LOC123876195 [Maniola jurtina]XP_045778332.1 uncharacterized protein LOC123876195 [Maniola jurtina]
MHKRPEMHRRVNPNVVRKLFIEDFTDEARFDNFANAYQESINQERIEKSLKWNFDFANEVPLEGTYEWYPANTDTADWIGVKSEEISDKTEESCLPMKSENETTPRSREDEALPVLRKRRRSPEVVTKKAVRRKISFD